MSKNIFLKKTTSDLHASWNIMDNS